MARARLLQSAGVEEQWEAVAGPWLRREARSAWVDRRPTVVLTPSRAESFYLRERMVAEGLSFFGLRFWTPSDARTFLRDEWLPGAIVAEEAELGLLARMGAERLAEKSDEPSLTSVRRDPRLFLRAYDLLLGAGWDPAKEGAAYGRGLAKEMGRLLQEHKVTTQAGLHRRLREAARKLQEPVLRRLLVCGFNGTHWPLWDLLLATVGAAEEAEVALMLPGVFGEKVDQLWIGSWEEEMGREAEQAAGTSRKSALGKWVEAYEGGGTAEAVNADFSFLAAPDLPRMAEGVVGKALAYLARPGCERLGIVFPEANALALEVARRLRELGVPLDDGTGFWRPGVREGRTWTAWLELQGDPCVERLVAWVRAAEAEGMDFGTKLSARDVAEAVDGALGETLIDRLEFLRLHLEERERGQAEAAKFLKARVQLPESGSLKEFLALTEKAVTGLGWAKRLRWDEVRIPAWMREGTEVVSRGTFLEWLREAGDSREKARSAEGNHFYGRVHLRLYAQMAGQTWSHLILTGLNEGRWPRLAESGAFGSRHELTALNKQARMLNRRVVKQGGQGQGHEAVEPGHGHCLLPLERYDLAVRDLCLAVEETSEAVCVAAMTSERGRALLPSDFFAQAYEAKMGRPLDEAAFSELGRAVTPPVARPAEKTERTLMGKEIVTTAEAYKARRDANRGYGCWEFAYAEPPARPVQLYCSVWEKAWRSPAPVWLEEVVGVGAWPEGGMAWQKAVGIWVHRWMKAALTEEKSGSLASRLRAVADREARDLRGRLERAQAEAYPWWQSVWDQARGRALNVAEAVAPLLEGKAALAEYVLRPRMVALPGAAVADFELKGRIDLLVLEGAFDAVEADFSGCAAQVVDFKTGSASGLTPANAEKGKGLQAMLYALWVRAAGAAYVGARLETGLDTAAEMAVEKIEAQRRLFQSLDRLHRQGVFGMHEENESDYGYRAAYPLATLRIDKEILAVKWALTHGAAELGGGIAGGEE